MGLRVGAALPAQFEHAVAQPPQERAVVRHEQHRALEAGQGVEQHVLGGEVQVVGGLVEHQEIGRIQHHPRDHEPRLLAAREGADLLVHVVARELERPSQAAQHADGFVREVLPQLLFDGQIGVEHLE